MYHAVTGCITISRKKDLVQVAKGLALFPPYCSPTSISSSYLEDGFCIVDDWWPVYAVLIWVELTLGCIWGVMYFRSFCIKVVDPLLIYFHFFPIGTV
ncbi:hypothetical protein CMV_008874 [Castanea mollissima]|uniref:Uncharacterized protein n=1 Tax=Castanea mollissima TaxID=60419 RepID=A0A8J4RFI5_9ROSI|nr:hypothetical protein CMV_008874 [Castanea mollissima]